ncbi:MULTISPECIES: hypothetical protein [unclassified Azospirillum]|uniref:hypothetical protein n=1 Tax=unclassified Azospirillum TaxID=2630922 RepID=UPI000B62D19C|nr:MULTISPECIES: hypothetical protein [unclassified Azospirillum]SNS99473.1 hypothetical protein SAMN05880556_11829 [Azospirillum sp. RU38E]SNT15639.1 hypothetical protein SAMN05880591_11829 [Azospirillum sp. RU37A]
MSVSSVSKLYASPLTFTPGQADSSVLPPAESAAAINVQLSDFAKSLTPSAATLFGSLSDETKDLMGKLVSAGSISQDTLANALNYFAKLQNNQTIDAAAGGQAGGNQAGPDLGQMLNSFENGGNVDFDAISKASAEYRRASLDQLNQDLAAGKTGYSLNELSAGAAVRGLGLDKLIAQDVGMDLSKGAL